MKLHTFPLAPNPTKVEVFLKEKGLDLAREIVVLPKGEQHDPAFLARNPLGRVPVLELDDGEFVAESLPILEYLEELHPEPSMIGRTPLERLRIRSLERMIDTSILLPVGRLVHSTRSPLPGVEPNEGMAAWARTALVKPLALLDERGLTDETLFVVSADHGMAPQAVPRSEFPDDLPLREGMQLMAQAESGQHIPIWISRNGSAIAGS